MRSTLAVVMSLAVVAPARGEEPGRTTLSDPAVRYTVPETAFIPDYEVGRRYTVVVRALYLPYESPEQVRRAEPTPDKDHAHIGKGGTGFAVATIVEYVCRRT